MPYFNEQVRCVYGKSRSKWAQISGPSPTPTLNSTGESELWGRNTEISIQFTLKRY